MHSHHTSMTRKRKHHNHSRLIYNQAYNMSHTEFKEYPFRHNCSVKKECYDWDDDYWVASRSTGWKTHKQRRQWGQYARNRPLNNGQQVSHKVDKVVQRLDKVSQNINPWNYCIIKDGCIEVYEDGLYAFSINLDDFTIFDFHQKPYIDEMILKYTLEREIKKIVRFR